MDLRQCLASADISLLSLEEVGAEKRLGRRRDVGAKGTDGLSIAGRIHFCRIVFGADRGLQDRTEARGSTRGAACRWSCAAPAQRCRRHGVRWLPRRGAKDWGPLPPMRGQKDQ
jgi:hypothetical protein